MADEAYDSYKYVPLKEYIYEEASIKPGAEVEILADMGGRPNNADTVFYYQFIVVNKGTGDTIRILCPQISVEALTNNPDDHKTFTTPRIYNMETGVTTAYYELIDKTKSLLLNVENMDKMVKSTDSADINHIMDPANAKEFVILDKNAPEAVNLRFKTAIGTLNFKKRPW